jgi:secondary thiamine-phosphate synthase enzyme
MKQQHSTITVSTRGPGFTDLTDKVRRFVRDAGIETGLLTLFLPHTSASLLIQENADPDVLRDLADAFSRLAPRDADYRHTTEGPDDMPAHIRAALTQTSLSIPVMKRAPALGTWQAIYLFEHRDALHARELMLHVIGD